MRLRGHGRLGEKHLFLAGLTSKSQPPLLWFMRGACCLLLAVWLEATGRMHQIKDHQFSIPQRFPCSSSLISHLISLSSSHQSVLNSSIYQRSSLDHNLHALFLFCLIEHFRWTVFAAAAISSCAAVLPSLLSSCWREAT